MLSSRFRRYLTPLLFQLVLNFTTPHIYYFTAASVVGYIVVVLRPSLVTWMLVRKDPIGRLINGVGVCLILCSISEVLNLLNLQWPRFALYCLLSAFLMSLYYPGGEDDKKFERGTDEKVKELVERVVAVHGPGALPSPA